MALFSIILFVASTAYSYTQSRKAKKRAAAARERAKDAAAQELRVTPAGQMVPILYGTTGSPGILAYATVNDNVPYFPVSNRIGVIRRTWSDNAILESHKGAKNEFFLGQYVIGVGDIEKVTDVWLDDQPTQTGTLKDLVTTEWLEGGVASPVASRFDEGHGDIEGTGHGERSADSTFNGLPYLTLIARHDRDDPRIYGVPRPFAFVRGRKIRSWSVARLESGRSWSANAVRVLTDYLTSDLYGPGLKADDLDTASWKAAQDVADQVVQGASSTIWDRSFPNDLNTLLGTGFARWSDYLRGQGFTREDDDGLPDSPSYPSGDHPGMRRYEFNGSVATTRNFPDAIDAILEVMPGAILHRRLNGKWGLSLPDPLKSAADQRVATIDDADLIDPVTIIEPDVSIKLNGATARFSNAIQALAMDSLTFPPVDSTLETALQTRDGGIRLTETIEIEGANNPYQAANILSTRVLLSRRRRFQWKMRASGILLEPGDIVLLKDELQGLDIHVRVETMRLAATDALTAELEAIEFEPTDYDWITSSKQVLANLVARDRSLGDVKTLTVKNESGLIVLTWEPADNEDVSVIGYEIAQSEGLDDDDERVWGAPIRVGLDPRRWTRVAAVSTASLLYRIRPVSRDRVGGWTESQAVTFSPGVDNRGLIGYANVLTRSTRVASAGAVDTNTKWHLSGTSGDWTGNRTLTLAGLTGAEVEKLRSLDTGALVTLFRDLQNWADYQLRAKPSVTSGVATIQLKFLQSVGDQPTSGAIAFHFTSAGQDGTPGRAGQNGRDGARGIDGIDGRDGSTWEYVFRRAGTQPATPTTTTAQDGEDDHIPTGWTDDPTGTDATNRIEWVSFRRRAAGAARFAKFSPPAQWSTYVPGPAGTAGRDGINGKDGSTWEYIFRRASSKPTAPTTNATQDTTDDYVPTGWTDDPVGTDINNRQEWVSFRRRGVGDRAFSKFGTPALWSAYVPGPRGIAGYANSIYRSTRNTGAIILTDSSAEYHFGSSSTGWVSPQTLYIGRPSADDKTALAGLQTGSLMTIYRDEENWADYQLTGPVVFRTNYAEVPLSRVESVGNQPATGGLRFHFTPSGKDGAGWEYVYQRANTRPRTPTTTLTQDRTDDHVPTGWTDDPSGVSSSSRIEWVSARKYVRGANSWSKFGLPVQWAAYVQGDASTVPGPSGGETQSIYLRTTGTSRPATPSSSYSAAGWTNTPTGVTITYKREWISQRKRASGAAAWGPFSTPALFSVYADGVDGASEESIYRRTTGTSRPTTPYSAPTTDDYVPSGWTDDPSGVSSTYRREWIATRSRGRGGTRWGTFSTPAVFSAYEVGPPGTPGRDGVDGQRGRDGVNGQSGQTYEFIFRRTTGTSRPTTPYSAPTTDDYVPSGWTDDPSGVSSVYAREWVSQRIKSEGSTRWGSFSTPSVWSAYVPGPRGAPGAAGAAAPRIWQRLNASYSSMRHNVAITKSWTGGQQASAYDAYCANVGFLYTTPSRSMRPFTIIGNRGSVWSYIDVGVDGTSSFHLGVRTSATRSVQLNVLAAPGHQGGSYGFYQLWGIDNV